MWSNGRCPMPFNRPSAARLCGLPGFGASIWVSKARNSDTRYSNGRLNFGGALRNSGVAKIARIVFVGVLLLAFGVVQVDQHGRTLGRRAQDVAELAERVLAHDLAVVDGLQKFALLLEMPDREVLGPEVRHYLEQLPFAVYS